MAVGPLYAVLTSLLALLAAACSNPPLPPAPATEATTVDRATAARLRAADSAFVAALPEEALRLAQPGVPAPGSPLIGRNREWGAMYAARFQMGTGGALRLTLRLGRADEARRAVAGLAEGLATMEPDGRLPARVPLSVSLGASPSAADVASGAAFYLGDACLGLLALELAPERDAILPASERARLRGQLARALSWLETTTPVLAVADRDAPNRLLFDARALAGCAALTGRPSAAAPFVRDAVARLAPGGWFLEKDGWDTSYQAVALEVGADVLAVLTDATLRASLEQALRRGTEWLTTRVGPDGRVNSSGNARTCDGGESFLGTPKRLAVASVVTGLGRSGTRAADATAVASLDAARRVAQWAADNPRVDPCFAAVSR